MVSGDPRYSEAELGTEAGGEHRDWRAGLSTGLQEVGEGTV